MYLHVCQNAIWQLNRQSDSSFTIIKKVSNLSMMILIAADSDKLKSRIGKAAEMLWLDISSRIRYLW